MKKTYDFATLASCMASRQEVALPDGRGWLAVGKIVAIEMEDGSGKCWNVAVATKGGKVWCFVRTS